VTATVILNELSHAFKVLEDPEDQAEILIDLRSLGGR